MSTAANITASVLGGLVGSAPGWAAIYLALRKQTSEIKTVTAQQTEDFKAVTATQTTEIKQHLAAQPPPGT